MRIKPSELLIPETEPFKHDKLSRTSQVKALSQLATLVDDPLVVSVVSPWGSGKTTMLKMLSAELKSKGLHMIRINAWETDFTDNALVSLIGEFQSALQELSWGGKRAVAPLKQVGKVGAALVETALPFAVRIASGGAISLPADLKGPVSDFLSKITEDQLRAYRQSQATIGRFKKTLTQALDRMGAGPGRPLVVLIDELDRCKPTYSIQMLEAAKHFFDIPHICFIIAIDESQIIESVKGLYGSGLNATEYLRKLVDLRYELSWPAIEEFCKSLLERFELSGYFQERTKLLPMRGDQQEFIASCVWLFETYKLSFRAQEQCFTRLSLVLI